MKYLFLLFIVLVDRDTVLAQQTLKKFTSTPEYKVLHDDNVDGKNNIASTWEVLDIEKHSLKLMWNECVGSVCSALKVSTKNDPVKALAKKYNVTKSDGFREGFGGGAFSGGGAGGSWDGLGGGGEFGGGGAAGSWDEKKRASSKNKSKVVVPELSDPTEECRWDLTRPPRIIEGPGCQASGARLCRGMVICKNYTRLATCSENFCQINTATACSKQQGYGSKTIQ
jgi:hypothetical protein